MLSGKPNDEHSRASAPPAFLLPQRLKGKQKAGEPGHARRLPGAKAAKKVARGIARTRMSAFYCIDSEVLQPIPGPSREVSSVGL
jgi:hypothetical protein